MCILNILALITSQTFLNRLRSALLSDETISFKTRFFSDISAPKMGKFLKNSFFSLCNVVDKKKFKLHKKTFLNKLYLSY